MPDSVAPAVAPDPNAAPPSPPAGDPAPSPSPAQSDPANAGDPPPAGASDWRSGLEGESLEFAKRYASPQDVVKSALDLRKANGSMVKLPGADAKPEDIAKFHKIVGAPETADGYFKPPAGEEFTDSEKAIFGKFGEIFHKHHVPATAAEEIHKAALEMADTIEGEKDRVAIEARKNNEAALRKEWGADYEANGNLAGRAMQTYGGDEFAAFLAKTIDGVKLGDHPLMIKAFGKVGRAMGEANFIGTASADQRQTLQAELQDIYAKNPPGSEGFKSEAVQKRMREINVKLYGEEPIVGRNRAA